MSLNIIYSWCGKNPRNSGKFPISEYRNLRTLIAHLHYLAPPKPNSLASNFQHSNIMTLRGRLSSVISGVLLSNHPLVFSAGFNETNCEITFLPGMYGIMEQLMRTVILSQPSLRPKAWHTKNVRGYVVLAIIWSLGAQSLLNSLVGFCHGLSLQHESLFKYATNCATFTPSSQLGHPSSQCTHCWWPFIMQSGWERNAMIWERASRQVLNWSINPKQKRDRNTSATTDGTLRTKSLSTPLQTGTYAILQLRICQGNRRALSTRVPPVL
jgi:hypothetical protein